VDRVESLSQESFINFDIFFFCNKLQSILMRKIKSKGDLPVRFKKFGARFEGDWLQIPDAGQVFLLSASLTYIF